MIKTHKPRGHFWTCASQFQHTKEFRNIHYEECVPPQAKILCPDVDAHLSTSERAAKRRRIEKLANDFLDGHPLLILSARPCEASVRSTLTWNERSRSAQKFALPELGACHDDDQLWEDVDDEWTVLDAFVEKCRPRLAAGDVTEERAQASCTRVRRSKVGKLSSQPSSVALNQAAAIRHRKLDKASTEDNARAAVQPVPQSLPEVPQSDSAIMSCPQVRCKPETARSEWLLRRNTTLCGLSVDESVDELCCSTNDTPSRTPKTLTSVRLSLKDTAVDVDACPGSVAISQQPQLSGTLQEIQTLSRRPLSTGFPNNDIQTDDAPCKPLGLTATPPTPTSLHTAVEHAESSSCAETRSQPKHSHERPPAQRDINAKSRKLRTLPNVDSSIPDAYAFSQLTSKSPHGSMKALAGRESIEASAQRAGNAKKAKRVKSASNTTSQASELESPHRRQSPVSGLPDALQRNSDPSVNHQRYASTSHAYTIAKSTQGGSTPFMFRRRGEAARGDNARPKNDNPRNLRGHVLAQTEPDFPHSQHERQPVAAQPPVLDMTFSHDSSFAPQLNMALVDEHMNSMLPTDCASAGRSSVLKKALRREMRKSGADIICLPSEPASSQAEEQPALVSSPSAQATDESTNVPASVHKPTTYTQWPGTQVLLAKAEHDLFSSPAKASGAIEHLAEATPHQTDPQSLESPRDTATRNPLRESSQVQQPGTQAMLDAWSPWSTVKKPVDGSKTPKRMPAPTMSSIGKTATSKVNSGSVLQSQSLTSALNGPARRRSSLRFSTTTTTVDSPSSSSVRLPFTVSKRRSTGDAPDQSPEKAPTPNSSLRKMSSAAKPSAPASSAPLPWDATTVLEQSTFDATEPQPTSDSTTQGRLPSFQAAQDLRDDSDPYRTMDEVTEYMMGDRDMDGVLSQVGA